MHFTNRSRSHPVASLVDGDLASPEGQPVRFPVRPMSSIRSVSASATRTGSASA